MEGLPPLPRRMVDRIREGEFAEFTVFPVFDSGRRKGEWRAELSEKEGSPGGRQSAEARRKGPREGSQTFHGGGHVSPYLNGLCSTRSQSWPRSWRDTKRLS